MGLSQEDGSCGPCGVMSRWREGQRLSCYRPREREGSGQGSCCVPAWGRDLAWQFPVRCEGLVRSSGLHLCPCEGGVWVWGHWILLWAAAPFRTEGTRYLLPAPQQTGSLASYFALRNILYSPAVCPWALALHRLGCPGPSGAEISELSPGSTACFLSSG